jgi:hypothetical protein
MFGRLASLQIQPSTGSGVEIDGLRVRFRVTRLPGKQDSAALDVWGLSLDRYQQIGQVDTVTRLVAGYEDTGTGELLQGTTVRGSVRREALDGEVVTSWQVQEAGQRLLTVQLAASWSGSVTSEELLDYVARQLGVARVQQALPRVVTYARGYTLPTSPRAALEAIAGDCGCRWTLAGGRLLLVPLNGSPARVRSVVLAPDSGLVGWPQQEDRGRVLCTALLQPGLLPGDSYRIEGRQLAGDYVVEEVSHAGDVWGDDWYTTVKGRPRR